jgi:hypothetical protein
MKMAVFWVVALCGVVQVCRRHTALIMEAASISETSMNFYHTTPHTRRNNPEDSHFHGNETLGPIKGEEIFDQLTDVTVIVQLFINFLLLFDLHVYYLDTKLMNPVLKCFSPKSI